MAKNGLNKELDFIVSVLKQRRIVPEQQRIEYLEKSLSVCVCAFFPFWFWEWVWALIVQVPGQCYLEKFISLCASVTFGFEGGIWLY